MTPDLGYCAQAARAADPDRFHAALFAPAQARPALFALLAFNAEVAKTRQTVSEPHIGLIRLTWWREALDEIAAGGRVRAHPVVEALAETQRRRPLALETLRELIDAREADLEPMPFESEARLFEYVEATGGGLHRALAHALGAEGENLDIAARGGTAWALTGLARSMAAGALEPRQVVPADWLSPGVSTHHHAMRLAGLACAAHREVRSAGAPSILPATLPAVLLPIYWRRIEQVPYREPSGAGRLLRLVWAAGRRRI